LFLHLECAPPTQITPQNHSNPPTPYSTHVSMIEMMELWDWKNHHISSINSKKRGKRKRDISKE